jgi:hypothetical protein
MSALSIGDDFGPTVMPPSPNINNGSESYHGFNSDMPPPPAMKKSNEDDGWAEQSELERTFGFNADPPAHQDTKKGTEEDWAEQEELERTYLNRGDSLGAEEFVEPEQAASQSR